MNITPKTVRVYESTKVRGRSGSQFRILNPPVRRTPDSFGEAETSNVEVPRLNAECGISHDWQASKLKAYGSRSEQPQHRRGKSPQVAQVLLEYIEDLAVVDLPIHVHQEISKPGHLLEAPRQLRR